MKSNHIEFWGFIDPAYKNRESLASNPNLIEMSKGEMFLSACTNILRNSYGFFESAELGKAVDKNGDDLPLYTYPAIEYLIQFDFSEKRVFEFGSGGSTLFWMKRAQKVISVENNLEWIKKLKPQLSDNASILHAEGNQLPGKIREADGVFDVIVVDSAGFRYDCATEAITKLAIGGIIILDNSDAHHNTSAMLKDSGLLQVDMTGFKPCESYTSTTSIFFQREFNFPTISERQPDWGNGAKRQHSSEWDKPGTPTSR